LAIAVLLVVVSDLYFLGAGVGPAEAHPELIVNPDRMLAGAIAFQRL